MSGKISQSEERVEPTRGVAPQSGNDTARRTWTVEEAGRILGVSRMTAYSLAKSGAIPVLKIGKRLLVPRAALERLLADV